MSSSVSAIAPTHVAAVIYGPEGSNDAGLVLIEAPPFLDVVDVVNDTKDLAHHGGFTAHDFNYFFSFHTYTFPPMSPVGTITVCGCLIASVIHLFRPSGLEPLNQQCRTTIGRKGGIKMLNPCSQSQQQIKVRECMHKTPIMTS